jgi:hypothetical protein
MKSGNTSHEEDGLASLIQGMLKARVSGQEPPPYVWKQIKEELEAETSVEGATTGYPVAARAPCNESRSLNLARSSLIFWR